MDYISKLKSPFELFNFSTIWNLVGVKFCISCGFVKQMDFYQYYFLPNLVAFIYFWICMLLLFWDI